MMNMKKWFVLAMALVMLALPLGVYAEAAPAPAVTEAPAAQEEKAPEAEAAPAPETQVAEAEEKEEAVPEKEAPLTLGQSLGYLAKGMVGIFLVTGLIILVLVILEKTTKGKKDEGQE